MEPQTAAAWLNLIFAVAVAVWIAASVFIARLRHRIGRSTAGSTEVEGQPDELLRRAAAMLTMSFEPTSPLQQAEIESLHGDTLRWRTQGTLLRHRGELRITPAGGGRSHADWSVAAVGRILLGTRWMLAGGALVLIALYEVLRTQALPSDDPSVRAQVFQMLQAVHVLWPPFAFAFFARLQWRRTAASVARLVNNLPYVEGEARRGVTAPQSALTSTPSELA